MSSEVFLTKELKKPNIFQRLFKQLPEEIEKNVNYALFVKNVVAYLVIASVEDRFGNKDIEYFQSYTLTTGEKTKIIEGKYIRVLEYFKLYHSAYTIPVSTLLIFVRTGYVNAPERIVAECGLLQSRNMANWERLWRCDSLSNEAFVSLLKAEKNRFYKKELEYAFEVAHLAGILLSLEKRDLVEMKNNSIKLSERLSIDNVHSWFCSLKIN